MRLSDYQRLAAKSQRYGDVLRFRASGQDVPVEFAALALAGEAGEIANAVKKVWRYDGAVHFSGDELPNRSRPDLIEELGDLLWYAAFLATLLDADLGAVAEANLNKLGVTRVVDEGVLSEDLQQVVAQRGDT